MEQQAPHSRFDALTGLLNRRAFSEVLTLEIDRAERDQLPLTMLIIDVDRLGHLNDLYGRSAGDSALQSIGTQVLSRVRRGSSRRLGDFVFRYGGDEFIVVLPATALDGALHLGRRLRQFIEKTHPFAVEDPGKISITIAACQYAAGVGQDRFIARTYQALMRAKWGGSDESGLPAHI